MGVKKNTMRNKKVKGVVMYAYFIIGRNHIDLDPVRMDSRLYFSRFAEDEWFESDFGRRVIKEIDQAEVLFGSALKNRFGKGMSTEQLSTGSKTLFLLKYMPDYVYYGSNMGDNCVPFFNGNCERAGSSR